ncbi:MAG TPA: hypothetical protein VLD16_05955 [Gaiellaceae bacterium]|nr:hypothetical protein [Gaiellaceae bacterium]
MSRREWLEHLAVVTGRLVGDLRERDGAALRRLRTDVEGLRLRVTDELVRERRDHPRLLVFLCGTTLMHSAGSGRTREERVAQARLGSDPTLGDYATYVPTEDAFEKLQAWSDQGAEISYLSYHRDAAGVAASADALTRHGFPPGTVVARAEGETYDDVVARAAPDILIEDDCTSTGSYDIAYEQLGPQLRGRISSIVVPQFGGLGQLPANLKSLLSCTA